MFVCLRRSTFQVAAFQASDVQDTNIREERGKGALKVADTAGEAGPVSTREMMGVRGLHPERVWPKSGARKGPSLKSARRVARAPRSKGAAPWDRTEGRGPRTLEQIQCSQYFVVCCLLSVVCCLLSVFCCLFSVVCFLCSCFLFCLFFLAIKLFIFLIYLLFVAPFVCYNEFVFCFGLFVSKKVLF